MFVENEWEKLEVNIRDIFLNLLGGRRMRDLSHFNPLRCVCVDEKEIFVYEHLVAEVGRGLRIAFFNRRHF